MEHEARRERAEWLRHAVEREDITAWLYSQIAAIDELNL